MITVFAIILSFCPVIHQICRNFMQLQIPTEKISGIKNFTAKNYFWMLKPIRQKICRWFFIFINFWWTLVHFWVQWHPCFGFLVISPLNFKARVSSLNHTYLWRYIWYMFPETHLWYDTFSGIYGQHSSQPLSLHVYFNRGRMFDSNRRPPSWKSDSITTQPQWPG